VAACALSAAAVVGATNAWLIACGDVAAHAASESPPSQTVAIVPGARVRGDRPLTLLQNRLESALELYQSGRVKTILVSGNDTPISPEVSVMRDWLRERGVPQEAILADAGGYRTRETMVRASTFFDVKHAIVCTETLNMPRTLYLARHSGIDAVGRALPTDLGRSPRWVVREALKNTLAFVESHVRSLPARPAQPIAHR
jgi:SanA protein